MPQQQQQHGQKKKKKKKGRAPAHQNSFAFQHNPRSKLTAAILATPIQHCCRRCHDKLEWRKKYRKYKPRTGQPGKCNHCQQRTVKAAYHTLCEPCTTRKSPKSRALLDEWNKNSSQKKEENNASSGTMEQQQDENGSTRESSEAGSELVAGSEPSDRSTTAARSGPTAASPTTLPYTRVCAVCAKEPALPDENDEDDQQPLASGRRLRLRERKTLERQQERASTQAATKQRGSDVTGADDDDDDYDQAAAATVSDGSSACSQEDVEDEDENDPFVKAVGGADKLLTGEAYQQFLLQKAERPQTAVTGRD